MTPQLTLKDCEHLFWLAARDIIFFHTYDPDEKDWGNGFCFSVCCNDTFYYASADCTQMTKEQAPIVIDLFHKYGWDGVTAWCSLERNEMPLKELQTDQFKKAYQELKERGNAS